MTGRLPAATFACVLSVALLASCGGAPVGGAAATDAVASDGVIEDCGGEDSQHGMNLNAEGRECLLAAFDAGRPAVFVSRAVTVEGAPIMTTYSVIGPEIVEVTYDGRQDPLGSRAIETRRCPRLVPVDDFNRVQGASLPEEMVFIEDGCELIDG